MIKGFKCVSLFTCMALLMGCSSTSSSGVNSAADLYKNTPTTVKGAAVGAVAGAGVGYAAGGSSGAPVGAVVGLAAGGVVGKLLEKHRTLAENLASRHVQVIRAGDYVKLVIPSSQLFVDTSSQLALSAPGTLDLVADLIKAYPKITVLVETYTYSLSSNEQINLQVTKNQASTILNYLWDQQIDARLIYAQGYGSAKPITYDPSQEVDNYRVEITLRELHPEQSSA